ncbi:ankyrin repeat-containing domain protein [Clohesyomyces aquaticus]|uniref:Ankyrin repeat-containing domain protein n=1 Tax=Clohesyomyces aquaticus TaxID=1231657 RepID=A0A1Y1YDB5_9PLEO|nr:ankyrin repeat-containing domain protein [Clohesyomyces aquaticus]
MPSFWWLHSKVRAELRTDKELQKTSRPPLSYVLSSCSPKIDEWNQLADLGNEEGRLAYAVLLGYSDTTRFLLQSLGKQQQDSIRDPNQPTALHCSAAMGRTELAKFLVDRAPGVFAPCTFPGLDTLVWRMGRISKLPQDQTLCSAGEACEQLFCAVHSESFRALGNLHALHLAIYFGHPDTTDALLKGGEKPSSGPRDYLGKALYIAAGKANSTLPVILRNIDQPLSVLLDWIAKQASGSKQLRSGLERISWTPLVQCAKDIGVDFDERDRYSRTILSKALHFGLGTFAEALVKEGVSIHTLIPPWEVSLAKRACKLRLFMDEPDGEGKTLLFKACRAQKPDFVLALLDGGVGVSRSELHVLARLQIPSRGTSNTASIGLDKIWSLACARIHDANQEDNLGNLPFLSACEAKNFAFAEALLCHSVNPSLPNPVGETCFHIAVRHRMLSTLAPYFAIDGTEPLNTPNADGETPMDLAVRLSVQALRSYPKASLSGLFSNSCTFEFEPKALDDVYNLSKLGANINKRHVSQLLGSSEPSWIDNLPDQASTKDPSSPAKIDPLEVWTRGSSDTVGKLIEQLHSCDGNPEEWRTPNGKSWIQELVIRKKRLEKKEARIAAEEARTTKERKEAEDRRIAARATGGGNQGGVGSSYGGGSYPFGGTSIVKYSYGGGVSYRGGGDDGGLDYGGE